MVRTHKKSKFKYCQIVSEALCVFENRNGYSRWYTLQGYVLQTELLNDNKNGILVEYLEEQDADEYVNEKRYRDEIKRLTVELETIKTKLKATEEKSIQLDSQIEWLTQNNLELGKLLEQERSKRTMKKEEE